MNTKLILIFTSLMIAPAFGMENADNTIASAFGMENTDNEQQTKQLLAWVVKANHIRVTHPQLNSTIQIDDNTIIKDIKTELFDREGILVEQQVLHAASTNWWMLGLTKNFSGPLPNDNNVKEIMSKHNTDVLRLFLMLRNDSSE